MLPRLDLVYITEGIRGWYYSRADIRLPGCIYGEGCTLANQLRADFSLVVASPAFFRLVHVKVQ
ncbi:unnamed protein product [Protopolystoma xenopodis]|uniref:Uncharacterized protein n=1 Tax=Protopolystoma xenopodis TaxID=117903 RepID=A0A3S5CPN0_9PLAT|nr:unnamed protein product [Protopolystoma xenopodis]